MRFFRTLACTLLVSTSFTQTSQADDLIRLALEANPFFEKNNNYPEYVKCIEDYFASEFKRDFQITMQSAEDIVSGIKAGNFDYAYSWRDVRDPIVKDIIDVSDPFLVAQNENDITRLFAKNELNIRSIDEIQGKEIGLLNANANSLAQNKIYLPNQAFPVGSEANFVEMSGSVTAFDETSATAALMALSGKLGVELKSYDLIWESPTASNNPLFSRKGIATEERDRFEQTWLSAAGSIPDCVNGVAGNFAWIKPDPDFWQDDSNALIEKFALEPKNSDDQYVAPQASDSPRLGIFFEDPTSGKLAQYSTIKNPLVHFITPGTVDGTDGKDFFKREILYFTTRSRGATTDAKSIFLNLPTADNSVSFGKVLVSIPRTHRRGQIDDPSWWNRLWGAAPDKFMRVWNDEELSEEEFYKKIEIESENATGKYGLIYVHGFRNTFLHAAQRTAQLAYDLQVYGPVVFFSWPTMMDLSQEGYLKSSGRNARAELALKAGLSKIAQTQGLSGFHLIGHSMGTKILVRALEDLEIDQVDTSIFNRIILAAPDIDVLVFEKEIYPRIKSKEKRFYVYASSTDKAIWQSNGINQVDALGGAGGLNVKLENLEVIDISGVPCGFICHSTYAEDRVIQDIFLILRHGHAPPDRNLHEIDPPFTWRFN